MSYQLEHWYEIRNRATGKYINLEGNHANGVVSNGEKVNLFSQTHDPDQRWLIKQFDETGAVRLLLQRGGQNYALNYNTSNGGGIIWRLKLAADRDTVLCLDPAEENGESCFFRLRDRNLYLTAVGGALAWQEYTGRNEQVFTFLEPEETGPNQGDSPLVTRFIPAYEGNYTKDRKKQGERITEITIHHCAGIMSIDALGALWQKHGRRGSSHYGVSETEIGQFVREQDVAWTNSDWEANCRAVTIETSNCGGAPQWPVSETSFQTLVKLVADIVRRNNLGKLVKGQNLTWHSMYTSTLCPGPYLLGRIQELVDRVNEMNKY